MPIHVRNVWAVIESSKLLQGLQRSWRGGVSLARVRTGSFCEEYFRLRGGVYLGSNCVIGPGCEVKSSFILHGSKLAHFNFIGDSLIGENVNIEASAIVANYRNELQGADIKVCHEGEIIETGVNKFGALVGDGCKVGANAVIAPGALIRPNTRVPRLGLIDQLASD